MTLKTKQPQTQEDLNTLLMEAHKNYPKNPSHSLDLSTAAVTLARELGDQAAYGKALTLKGTSFVFLSRYPEALPCYHEAQAIAQTLNQPDLLMNVLYHKGNMYTKLGDLENALEDYLAALEYSKSVSIFHQVTILNNISVIYSKLNQMEESLAILLETLKLSSDQPKDFKSFVLANIAEVYLKLGRLPEAAQAIREAEATIVDDFENVLYKAQFLKAKAKLLNAQGHWETALDIFNEAISSCIMADNDYRVSSILREKAQLHFDQGQYEDALTCILRAENICKTVQANVEMRDLLLLQAQVYEHLHQYQQALESMKRYTDFQERIKTETLENMLLKEQLHFENEAMKKEAEIAHLKKEEALLKAETEAMRATLLEDNLKDIQTIVEIGQQITATLELPVVIDLIHDHIKRLVDVNVAGIALYQADTQMIHYQLLQQNGQDFSGRLIPLDDPDSYAAQCLRSRETIVEQQLTLEDVSSAIFIPLFSLNEPIGVLTLQSPSHQAFNATMISMLEAVGVYVAIALKNSQQSEALLQSSKAFEKLSQTDALTGLYNRRHMDQVLEQVFAQSDQPAPTAGIAILDIDHFKDINDTLGHPAGDAVLVQLAALLKQELGEDTAIARWGGEEFLIFLPEVDAKTTEQTAIRLCQKVAKSPFTFATASINVTITIGAIHSTVLALYGDQTQRSNPKEVLIQLADKALYKGKANGRNQAKMYQLFHF